MQKRKNIRSTFKLFDFIVTIICLIGVVTSLSLFISDLNLSLLRLNEKPIAVIYFKHNTAQRRFVDRNLWERLKSASPIYNGDRIRTSDFSEAFTVFPDGTKLELYENTLIQLFRSKKKTSVNFVRGSITAEASYEGYEEYLPLTITAGGKNIAFESNSKASLVLEKDENIVSQSDNGDSIEILNQVNTDKTLAVSVISGSVSLAKNNAENAETTLTAGQSVLIKSETGSEDWNLSENQITVFMPSRETSFIKQNKDSFSTVWFWESNNIVTYEFSFDEDFSEIVKREEFPIGVKSAEIQIKTLEDTNAIYWRVAQDNELGGVIHLQEEPKEKLAEVMERVFTFENVVVVKSLEEVKADVGEVASVNSAEEGTVDEAIDIPTENAKAESGIVSTSSSDNSSVLQQEISSEEFAELQVELQSPSNDIVLDESFFESGEGLKFTWNKIEGAESYKLEITNTTTGSTFSKIIKATNYSLSESEMANTLDEGVFNWKVVGIRPDKTESSSEVYKFEINLADLSNVEVDQTNLLQ